MDIKWEILDIKPELEIKAEPLDYEYETFGDGNEVQLHIPDPEINIKSEIEIKEEFVESETLGQIEISDFENFTQEGREAMSRFGWCAIDIKDEETKNCEASGFTEENKRIFNINQNDSSSNDEKFEKNKSTKANIKMLKCPECSKEFKRKYYFRKHMLFHNNLKRYKCSYCNFESNMTGTLKRHLDKHELFCSECNFKCHQMISLKTHMLRQHADSNLKCYLCDFSYSSENVLNNHMLTHKPKKILKCFRCRYECNSDKLLNSHMLTHRL